MKSMLRQFRRAPGRIIASVFALALAVGAIGVLAIPAVSSGTLREAAAGQGLADIIVDTTPLDGSQLARINQIDNVAVAEGQATVAVRLSDGFLTRLIGLDFATQTMDIVQLDDGRLPAAADEVVAGASLGALGDHIVANGTSYQIVGHGGTLWWSDSDVLYADIDSVTALTEEGGTNRLVITAAGDSIDELRTIAEEVRSVLRPDGDTYTTFPTYLPDGSTPIDQDIEQVSTLIGLLGMVAGLVALVLLASTTNTLITERTREVAVMRALGGRSRPLRRRLRRISFGITSIALVIGLPLGVLISNYIARMVLEEFVGITPAFAIDWRVLVGSAIGMLAGARLVAARAARRVTKLPLAEALRDREGAPFGGRWTHRVAARAPFGGLFSRIAARESVHRPARTLAVVVQISAAVGAAFLIPSLANSVNEFNSATHEPWAWESLTVARDAGLPFAASITDDLETAETGIYIEGELEGWQIDLFGLSPDTEMFDPKLTSGRWITPAGREAVVSAGFAERNGLAVGDSLLVELASGEYEYRLIGLSNDFSRSAYVDRSVLAADLGTPGMANTVMSTQDQPGVVLPVAARTSTADDLAADDNAARAAIVTIFGAIGVIVAGVASLAVLSSMTVSLFERRHELAALQALGARRRRLRGLLIRELLPLGAIGVVGGLALGALGTRGIIMSFEASNAVDIGVVDAVGSIPFIAAGTLAALVVLALVTVRSAARRPVAVTLRGAA
jgi:putative ABC transport system permease protein